jgi:hypothetical protein
MFKINFANMNICYSLIGLENFNRDYRENEFSVVDEEKVFA